MFYLLTVLILIASIALVLLVIVQKSKGGTGFTLRFDE